MKKRTTLYAFTLLLWLFMPFALISQEWGGSKPNGFWDHWAINANMGLTSYFGDLSYYDSDISEKISNESGPAFGVLLTKYFNNKFGVSGQLLYGNLGGGTSNKNSFETSFFEYNLQFKLDLIRIFMHSRNPKFGFEGIVGVGHLWFNVDQYEYNEGQPVIKEYASTSPEFVYFAGMGMHYHISESLAITSSFSLRQIQNDRLDNFVKNKDYDFYSYLNVGITYYFSGWGSSISKNKSRVAHTGIRSL